MAWGVRAGATATVSGGSGLGTSFTLALGAAVVVGDRIVVDFSGGSGAVGFTVNSITDSLGNTYTQDASVVQSTGNMAVQAWSAPVTTAGTPTLTINMSDFAFNGCSVAVATYTGLSTVSGAGAIDSSATASGTANPGSLTINGPHNSNQPVIGFWGDVGTANSSQDAVAGTGFTQRVSALPHTGASGDAIIEDKDGGLASNTNETVSFTNGSALAFGLLGIMYALGPVVSTGIYLREEASSGAGFNATSMAVTFPTAPSANDIVILTYHTANHGAAADTRSWPTGFTEFVTYNDSNIASYAAWKRAGAGESATYTLTLTGTTDTNQLLVGQVWVNCVTSGSPIDVLGPDHYGGFITLGTVTFASITTLTDGAVHVLNAQADPGPSTQPAVTNYTGLRFSGVDNAAWWYGYYRTISPAGATGTPTLNLTAGNSYEQDFSYALKPVSIVAAVSNYGVTFGNRRHAGPRYMYAPFTWRQPLNLAANTSVSNLQSLIVTSATSPSIVKQAQKLISLNSASVVSIVRQVNKVVSLASASVTSILKQPQKVLTLTSATTSTVLKQAQKVLSLASATTSSVIKQAQKVLTLSSSTTSTMTRLTGKVLSLSSASTSTVLKQVGKVLTLASATVSTIAAMKTRLQSLVVTSATTVSITKLTNKIVSVSSSTTSSIVRQVTKVLSLSSATTSTITRSIGKGITLASSTSVSVLKQVGKPLTVVSATGSSVLKQVGKVISLASATSTTLLKQVTKIVSVSSATSGVVLTIKVRIQSLIVSSATSPSMTRLTTKIVSVSSASTSTMSRLVGKLVSVSSPSTVSITKLIGKAVTVSSPTVVTVTKLIGKGLSVTSATTSSLLKQANKLLVAASASSSSLLKQVGKVLSVASATSSVITSIKIRIQALIVTSATSPSVTRLTTKIVSVSSATTPTVTRLIGKIVSVGSATVTSVTKTIGKLVVVASPTASVVAKTLFRTLAVASVTISSMSRQITKLMTVTSATGLTVLKSISKTITVVSGTASSLTKRVIKVISVSSATASTLTKNVGKVVSVASSTIASILNGSVTHLVRISLVVVSATTSSITKSIGKNLVVISLTQPIVNAIGWTAGGVLKATSRIYLSLFRGNLYTLQVRPVVVTLPPRVLTFQFQNMNNQLTVSNGPAAISTLDTAYPVTLDLTSALVAGESIVAPSASVVTAEMNQTVAGAIVGSPTVNGNKVQVVVNGSKFYPTNNRVGYFLTLTFQPSTGLTKAVEVGIQVPF